MSGKGHQDLSSKQLAKELGVSPGTIRTWVKRGKIQGYAIENRRFFTREETEQFKAQRAAKQVTKS